MALHDVHCCANCLHYRREADAWRQKYERERRAHLQLRRQLGRQPRRPDEPVFGASTPSSLRPLKPNATPDQQAKRGGGQPGHRGHGRRRPPVTPQTVITHLHNPTTCPYCQGVLLALGTQTRDVLDRQIRDLEHQRFILDIGKCPHCHRLVRPAVPNVLPKSLYGNTLLAELVTETMLHGHTLGESQRRLAMPSGSVCDSLRRVAKRFAAVLPHLVTEYRQSIRKHADETRWRNDGRNWYLWLFTTPALSLFCLRPTRAHSVLTEILGTEPLPGVLNVDRYAAYNFAPCALQYCYAHLLRDVEELLTRYPDAPEVAAFVAAVAEELAAAMRLWANQPLAEPVYYAEAQAIAGRLQLLGDGPARHPAVQDFQGLLRRHRDRLYHWAADRRIPPDNNFAERTFRPAVIARHLSFGSQSDVGAQTREILMSVVHTLRQRGRPVVQSIRDTLNVLARDATADPYPLLFPAAAAAQRN